MMGSRSFPMLLLFIVAVLADLDPAMSADFIKAILLLFVDNGETALIKLGDIAES